MARQEEDREDLLGQAKALVSRAELEVPDLPSPVFIGFRRDGCGSVYLGPDEAYQFNTQLALRRAYRANLLYKAEHGKLCSLRRVRQAGQVQLVRHDLTEEETADFLQTAEQRLHTLRERLIAGHYRLVGQQPADEDIVSRARKWLERLDRVAVALAPNAK